MFLERADVDLKFTEDEVAGSVAAPGTRLRQARVREGFESDGVDFTARDVELQVKGVVRRNAEVDNQRAVSNGVQLSPVLRAHCGKGCSGPLHPRKGGDRSFPGSLLPPQRPIVLEQRLLGGGNLAS